MKPSNLFLAIVAILIMLVSGLAFGGLAFLRGAAGLLFVLFLPGWAITAAFFTGREFDIYERLALSIGFSVTASILSGLALHLTPWGLQTGLWAILLAGVTVIARSLALLRKRTDRSTPVSAPAGLKLTQLGLIALALLVAGLSIAIARQPTPAGGFEGYTSFWIFPVQTDEGYAVQLGMSSMEFETVSYRLELQQGGQLIHEFPDITLSPGESTQVVARLDGDQDGESPVQALLYRLDEPEEPYREVTWWPGDGLE